MGDIIQFPTRLRVVEPKLQERDPSLVAFDEQVRAVRVKQIQEQLKRINTLLEQITHVISQQGQGPSE